MNAKLRQTLMIFSWTPDTTFTLNMLISLIWWDDQRTQQIPYFLIKFKELCKAVLVHARYFT